MSTIPAFQSKTVSHNTPFTQQLKTTTYRHPEWDAERKPIPLLQRHSIGLLVDEILTANELDQYTGVLLIGKSGSGKTTLTQTLCHRLHQLYGYRVAWFEKKDIQNFVQIVKKMPKVPTIIVFQDASYALNGLGDDEINEIASQLTFIRHNTASRIIVMIQIHYSKAIEKFFRDTDITICTSITDNERTNIKALFGEHNSSKVDHFIRQYHDQKFKKKFKVKTTGWNDAGYTYHTNEPFRIGLVSSIGTCHSLLYPREICGFCAEPKKRDDFATMDSPKALQYLKDSCKGNMRVLRATLRNYMFVTKGRKVLPTNNAALWNVMTELDHDTKTDWDEVYDLMMQDESMPRNPTYRNSKKTMEIKKEIQEHAKDTLSAKELLTNVKSNDNNIVGLDGTIIENVDEFEEDVGDVGE